MLLQLQNISVHYGGVKALDGVDISLDEGEIVALIGPNGAGKSTILKTIFGLELIHSGNVLWQGKKIIPVSHEVVQRGISFVPQGRRVFSHLTIEENLEIGGFIVSDKTDLKRRIVEVMKIFPVLNQRRTAKAGTLSGGQQQMLALARGLMTEPKVLLLDEPSLGLAPKIVKEVFMKIKEINKKHKTAILVVEHNITFLLDIANRGYVLDKGNIVAKDDSQKLFESGVLENVFMGKSI
ncbi:MAG: ABC transporter ATP-binding protein [Candidatus Magasanikbacteria bacterium]|uniref:ABC transporter ATP-binding protein n=1 Tax=Candidatus Magasanikbacteria bacterium CG10_big_fil_rev_8_21_14_0_10_38_6 TaxID=1974647 RepID=A0A2M6P036_9BACT|nr:ABC transporter ATP-binding protein [Candidatus Magasanikbacteria bacterium]NCS71771.1 ABC transporter ATP-binding protein [Candidatus Magasanikbacteria bacterium]PIR77061.1 MAG: ABC transporter ATP-binding protein [Candidatus Magasanikbacteria bacterium CG10_big_fil_rev_8_21_14_0_10_38_6]